MKKIHIGWNTTVTACNFSGFVKPDPKCHRFPFFSSTPRALYPSFLAHVQSSDLRGQRSQYARLKHRARKHSSRSNIVRASGQSLFPSGQKQAKVKLPALVLETTSDSVLEADGTELRLIEEAVRGGATAVVLSEGTSQTGAGRLYDAACRLKTELRGRAALLVIDRTDIADAAGADGVLLSAQGVPIAVARRLLSGAGSLVGCIASDAAAAASAAEQGANLVILRGKDGGAASEDAVAAAVVGQRAGSIPIVASVAGGGEAPDAEALLKLAASPSASGLCLPTELLRSCAAAIARREDASAEGAAAELVAALRSEAAPARAAEEGSRPPPAAGAGAGGGGGPSDDAAARHAGASGMKQLLSAAREDLVVREKELLGRILALLREVSPEIEEMELLEDAINNLDELFLLVVVGEFNSGKSTFINALLGERFLAEGILPTTNEISILRWAEDGQQRAEQDADGMYQRYLPADLLREINIVDTPGTNVVLERQQRLTEEYIPRADLVLFVMSADRPFTESEVKFLKYIRQWGKKVVFVLNKADLLQSPEEVQQVVGFVSSNALQLLGVDDASVLPVSSRSALAAKLDAGSRGTAGVLSTIDDERLASSEAWARSGYPELESFLLRFLVGSEEQAGESIRLKLQTPLAIADALLGASEQQLLGDLSSAEKDLKALEMVEAQLGAFRAEMDRDSAIQRESVQRLVRSAVGRAEGIVDRELQLSSSSLSTYLFGSKAAEAAEQPVARAVVSETSDISSELQKIVAEHSRWVTRNVERQVASYRAFAESRAKALGIELSGGSSEGAGGGHEGEGQEATALVTVSELQPASVAVLLNEDVRESFVVTGSAVAGAAALEAVGTALLPTTLEDLMMTAVAGVFAYLAVLNLPLRRAETKAKVQRVAANFSREVSSRMEAELEESLNAATAQIMSQVEPLIQAARAEVERIRDNEARRAALSEQLEEVKEATMSVK